MSVNDALYRYFVSQREGCSCSIVANLSGVSAANLHSWLDRHCDVGMALGILWRAAPREWLAVAIRWHYLLEEDDAGRLVSLCDQRALDGRRRGVSTKVTRAVWHRACQRQEHFRRLRQIFEALPAYSDGMAVVEAMLTNEVSYDLGLTPREFRVEI